MFLLSEVGSIFVGSEAEAGPIVRCARPPMRGMFSGCTEYIVATALVAATSSLVHSPTASQPGPTRDVSNDV